MITSETPADTRLTFPVVIFRDGKAYDQRVHGVVYGDNCIRHLMLQRCNRDFRNCLRLTVRSEA
jgi:hypothetical protein